MEALINLILVDKAKGSDIINPSLLYVQFYIFDQKIVFVIWVRMWLPQR